MNQLPEHTALNIRSFSHIFDNKAESYKLFWFQSLFHQVLQGKRSLSFEEIIDEMIADAWYMVSEYHLNLGPFDKLEETVNYLSGYCPLIASEKKETILQMLKESTDPKLRSFKRTLSLNVPYRLQAPFFVDMKWNLKKPELIARINGSKGLIYTFEMYDGLNTRIVVAEEWAQYFMKHPIILESWIEYNMVTYLQRRNPSTPGIIYKLRPPVSRSLGKVQKYWKHVMTLDPVVEIYDHQPLDSSISIDYFVPWSYVAHDEFWNLHPTTRSINSSKGNQLPEWNTYFHRFCDLQYRSYSLMWQYDTLHQEFERLAREHINDLDIKEKLYQPGLDPHTFVIRMNDVIYPVYHAAMQAGFKVWNYESNH